MKPLQLLAVLATFFLCLAGFAWIVSKTQLGSVTSNTSKFSRSEAPKEEPKVEAEKDHYDKNPFKPATGPEFPVAELPETTFEFGKMGLGKVGKHDFVVKNTGKAPLKIARGPTQCKCTVTGLKDQEVPPGGEASIHLEWEPKSLGPFGQTATIWTNDPANPELTIGVEGTMYQEIELHPMEGWKLGNLIKSEPTKFHGTIQSSIIPEFKITKIETSSDRVTVKERPLTEEEKHHDEATYLSGYRLEGELAGVSEPGKIEEKVTVYTDLEDYPKFEIALHANRIGAITIIGPQWTAGGPTLNLGKISAEKGKETKLTVMLPPGEEEFKILDFTSDPGFIKVELKPESVGKELSRERYSLYFNVPPGSPKGVWGPGREGRIVLKTNHPQVREMDIKVHVDME